MPTSHTPPEDNNPGPRGSERLSPPTTSQQPTPEETEIRGLVSFTTDSPEARRVFLETLVGRDDEEPESWHEVMEVQGLVSTPRRPLNETDAAGRQLYSDGSVFDHQGEIPSVGAVSASLSRLGVNMRSTPTGPLFVALGGPVRAGKDTVADYLVAKHRFVKVGMSDALHEALATLDPVVSGDARYSHMVEMVGYVEAKKIPEVRRLLRALGTEVGRKLDEDLWVKAAERRIQYLRGEGHPVVLTGVRFPNELEMVRELGGHPVWISRPGAGDGSDHASDVSLGLSDFSWSLENNRDIPRLQARTRQLLGYLEAR